MASSRFQILFLIFAAIAQAQPSSGRRLVLVDVVVRNKAGAVPGLTKDDFTLTDKGKAQAIEVFRATAAVDPAATLAPPSPQVGTNRLTRRGDVVRSATIILFDRINTPPNDQGNARLQILQSLASIKESEVFGFYSLGKGLTVVHDFTGDPGPVIRAAARMSASPPKAAPNDPVEQAAQKALEDAVVPLQAIDLNFRVATTARAFQSIARHLSGVPGRKSVAWITRTFPATFGSDTNRRAELEKEMNDTTVALQEENVALYPISPGGVGRGFDDGVTPDTPKEGRLMPGANSSINESGALSDNSTLASLAAATGGDASYSSNQIGDGVQKVLRDADMSYRLGYYPDNKMLDGKAHDFGVKVKSPGTTLRFRKKYFASKEDPRKQPALPALAADPLEATAIQLAAYAQPDTARPGFQQVSVAVTVNDLALNHEGDHWTGAFEFGLSLNGSMSATGEMQIVKLDLTDQQMQQAQTSGLLVEGAVKTHNESVTVRAIVRDKSSGTAGAVTVPLVVRP